MLKTSLTSIILKPLINKASANEIGRSDSGSNATNLSNSFAFKKSTKVGYLIFKGAKKGGNNLNSGGGNTKKDVEAGRGFNYLTLGAKKFFNLLLHVFTKALIFQYFDLEQYIRIQTNTSSYNIGGVLSQLISNDLRQ